MTVCRGHLIGWHNHNLFVVLFINCAVVYALKVQHQVKIARLKLLFTASPPFVAFRTSSLLDEDNQKMFTGH